MDDAKRKRITETAILAHRAAERYHNAEMLGVSFDPNIKEQQSIDFAIVKAEYFETKSNLENEILSGLR